MTEEQIKAKAKDQFPNDEFKQQIVIDAINWATKELEKENAELKEKREQDCDSSWYEGFNCSEKERLKQLTKAKELLERFLGLGNLWNLDCKDYFPLRKEAEQFLSEVEK